LVKLDSDGNTVWKREIGLIGLDGLAVTPDGSFVVVGATDEEKKGHLMLFDRDGNELWEHQIDGRIETVAVSKSGYVVAGPRDRYIYLYDKDGELVFKHFAGSYYSARDVAIAPDETYFLFGSEHRYLSCYTLEGDLLWQREVGPLYNIRISTDGECIVVGTSRSTLFFFDRNGGKLWDKKVTDAFFIDEIAISGHGEYIAIDTMEFSSPLSQRYIAVYSKEGDFLWRYQSVYPNPFVAIAMSNDGHYIAAGNRGLFLLFDNFQAIEEYKSSECAQSDTSHVSDPDQRILLLGQPGLIPFLTVLLIAILVGILIIIYLSRRKIEKKA
jgi:outer membrane protein assembly factor BamB